MKKILPFILLLLCGYLYAQAPEKFTYQAVIRDQNQQLVKDTLVGVQFTLLRGTSTGPIEYQEQHSVRTNRNGLVSLEIGTGTVIFGAISTVDWGADNYFIEVETDPSGGTNYTLSGVSQLLSVPYALHAESATTVDSLNITGNEPAFAGWDKDVTDDFDGQYSSLTGAPTNVSAFTNDAGYLTSELDGDPTNEIQVLSISNDTLSLSNGGGSVTLSSSTDSQDLSLSGNTLSLTNDPTPVDLSGYLDNTDNQNLTGATISGTTLQIDIQGGNSATVDLVSLVDDADADPTNEYNTGATLNGTNLEISDGAEPRP